MVDDVAAHRREQAAVLAVVEAFEGSWHQAADVIESAGGALALLEGSRAGLEEDEARAADAVAPRVEGLAIQRWVEYLDEWLASAGDLTLLTVSDAAYPTNLRAIYNRPPFLFVKGELRPEDQRSIAVVGSRKASSRGLAVAARIASDLAEAGVTVISGLARGVDTAAHTAALEAGGRTVAVMGTGIEKVYPAENKDLAGRICGAGALVSQFWPTAPPRSTNFPIRNVVTSGMAVGTLVVEAKATSGAKMQARLALEHGKRLFLVQSLVMQEDWAKRYAERPGTTVVASTDDIIRVLVELARPAEQLTLM